MALVSVTFSITEKQLPKYSGDALESVIVRVFSEDGETFVTQGTTDSDGELILELEDETTYWVRFFLEEYAFDLRLTVDVDSGASSNTFDVMGQYLSEYPPSSNNYLCRVSGFVGGAAWAPVAGVTFTFSLTGKPRIVAGRVMVIQDVVVQSDSEGWVEVELARNAVYDCTVAGMEDSVFRVAVPDEDSVSITELIWPYSAELEYSPTSISVEVNDSEEVGVVLTLSSGVETPFELDDGELCTPASFLQFTVEDESIASIEWNTDGDTLTISGIAAGTTTLSVEVIEDSETEREPEPTRSLSDLTITVTE